MRNFMINSKWGVLLLSAVLVTACGTSSATSSAVQATATAAATTVQQNTTPSGVQLASAKLADLVTFDEEDTLTTWSADNSTTIALNGTSATISGSGAEAKAGLVTINAAGTYVLSGKLTDGQLVVNVQDKGTVHLVFNGVDIQDSDSAPVYIKQAGKVILTLQEGTENTLTDGANYVFEDAASDEPGAALFSKADLTINGTGKLTVNASYKDGITSKDDLKIMSGTIEVHAADDGIIGRDMVAVQEGTITITADGDGIKSTNDEDAAKGFVAIAAGTFDIKAGNDGIQAETALLTDGGTYTIVSGGGNANGGVKTEDRGGMSAPPGGWTQGTVPAAPSGTAATTDATADAVADAAATEAGADEAAAAETESTSAKGLKAGGNMTVNSGSFTIDAADDAVHSNSNVTITGGELTLASGDDGIHAEATVTIASGKIEITKSYEGIEGANIIVSGGETKVVASDDGVNVSGGNEQSAGGAQGQSTDTAAHVLTISGGDLTVDATGDGLDSNGSIVMTGGNVIANGPTNGGNGTLDYDGTFELSGGYLVAAGSSGMAQAPSEDSSQYSLLMTYTAAQEAGTLVHLEDNEGNTLLTFAPSKTYQTVAISSPELKEGATYTLYTGGTSTGTEVNGLYADGQYSGGTKVTDFEITSSVTYLSESGVTTGNTSNRGGGGGFGGGARPEGGTPPEGGTWQGDGTPPDRGTAPQGGTQPQATTGTEGTSSM
ncbi:carbohydrate-binding domain-containing protein [Paenibacillus donghaensis]|uniref:Dockerin type 1 n=1 Tax=Paenibacillus donghaensis TaxID=414771 RepID=A0A2Z2KX34_9BACL|nr:carbohydrate-binding domain-containing protein [Paenibacillus donghaensis]ASA24748.1 dockerin type 1 [Paenibacillus donghaensis]